MVLGDCLEKLRDMNDNSVDSVVTDPPYGLKFMGKKWDHSVPSVEVWKECLRVLKPGGHMLVACGTRTQHRMVVNIEDAGFEIRDVITWLYGSGFPKSLDVSKAIDKAAGAEREVVGPRARVDGRIPANEKSINPYGGNSLLASKTTHQGNVDTAAATDAAKQWQGWGTALKPAVEFWTLCRKPIEGTVAENVQKYGTGGINVDGCRVSVAEDEPNKRRDTGGYASGESKSTVPNAPYNSTRAATLTQGRFPANLILDEEAGAMLDEQSGTLKNGGQNYTTKGQSMFGTEKNLAITKFAGDSGGASRFFYCAKASKSERGQDNKHPTVKPIKLMSYLCRLITPPNGIVLDPFMGSGSTGVAAKKEGFEFIGIELDKEYFEIAEKRINPDPQCQLL